MRSLGREREARSTTFTCEHIVTTSGATSADATRLNKPRKVQFGQRALAVDFSLHE